MDLNSVEINSSEADRKIRADALLTARKVIYGQGAYGPLSVNHSAVADTLDVITVAKWIVDGFDPWPEIQDDTQWTPKNFDG